VIAGAGIAGYGFAVDVIAEVAGRPVRAVRGSPG